MSDPVLLDQPLSPRECADLAGVSYHSILRAIHRGDLQAHQPRGLSVLRVHPRAFHDWLYGTPVDPDPPREREAPAIPRTTQRGSPSVGSVARLKAIEGGDT